MADVIIRQGGLRFHWDWGHHVKVRAPDGRPVDELTVPRGRFRKGATLDEVHDVIDKYVEALETESTNPSQ